MTQGLPRVTQFLDLTYKHLSKTCVHDAVTAVRDVIPGPNIQLCYVTSAFSKTCVRDAGSATRDVIPGPINKYAKSAFS